MDKHTVEVMGTFASIHVPAHASADMGPDRCAAAVRDALSVLTEVDGRFSHYRANSDIERWLAGEVLPAAVQDEIDGVLTACRRLEALSGGAFSALDQRTGRLDTAGYVKGYAIARAADSLTLAGLGSFLIGVGGDCYASGTVDGSRPWGVMVAHPDRPHQVLAVVSASDLAVATSGTAQRGEHIWGVRPHWRQFTVVGPRVELADAYATIGYALGDRAPAWFDRRGEYRWLAVDPDGRLRGTAVAAGLPAALQP